MKKIIFAFAALIFSVSGHLAASNTASAEMAFQNDVPNGLATAIAERNISELSKMISDKDSGDIALKYIISTSPDLLREVLSAASEKKNPEMVAAAKKIADQLLGAPMAKAAPEVAVKPANTNYIQASTQSVMETPVVTSEQATVASVSTSGYFNLAPTVSHLPTNVPVYTLGNNISTYSAPEQQNPLVLATMNNTNSDIRTSAAMNNRFAPGADGKVSWLLTDKDSGQLFTNPAPFTVPTVLLEPKFENL